MDRRMLFAAGAVAILTLAGVGIAFIHAGSQGASARSSGSARYPVPPANVAVADRPAAEAETTLAISPTDPDTIVAGANDFNTLNGDKWCGYYTSHDRGASWKTGFIKGYPGGPTSPLTGFDASSDGVIATDRQGDFYYAGLAFKRHVRLPGALSNLYAGRADCMFVAKSTDRGDTFGLVTVVSTSIVLPVRMDDKEWLAVDPVKGSLYLVWVIFSGTNTSRVVFSKSTDGDQSWSTPAPVSGFGTAWSFINTPVVVDKSGTIHISWTDYITKKVYYTRSSDGGNSFSAPAVVAPVVPIPDPLPHGDFRTDSGVVMAVDTSDTNTSGSLYVAWADYGSGDSDILLSYSHDGGKSWQGPVRVNNDTEGDGADQFFSAVAVSPEGWVHVTFYDRRSDPNDTLMEYWWAISFDGGASFPVNMPMSNASFNGAYSPGYPVGTNNDFMGDYTAVAADNRTVAAVWCDTRNASETAQDSDIYGAFVPYKELLKGHKFANVTVPWPGEKSAG
jgi:hypothetical protein